MRKEMGIRMAGKRFHYEADRVAIEYPDGTILYVDKNVFNFRFNTIFQGTQKDVSEQFALHYEWRDVVRVNGKCYVEAFPISGKMDDADTYQIDDFLEAVSNKHNIKEDLIETYMMDGIDFDPKVLNFGAEDCGCYIDGVAEWKLR